jgi:hypothetical protein
MRGPMSDEEEQQDGQPEPGGAVVIAFSGSFAIGSLGGGVPGGD